MKFDALKDFISKKLSTELAPELMYHSFNHTMEVYQAAQRYAEEEKIIGEDLHVLLTAVLFHDSGFIIQRVNHEERSCDVARSILPQFDYTEEEIDRICNMIMATRIPQQPKTHLEEIMCDADLDYLGRNDYTNIADGLYEEMRLSGQIKTESEWTDVQIRFLEQHKYHTETARKWRNEGKSQNLYNLKSKVSIQPGPAPVHAPRMFMEPYFRDIIFVILGILSICVGLNGLLVPAHFFDGGVTGISLLLHEHYHFNIALIIVAVNIPFIIFGGYTVGWRFAVKTALAMIGLGIALWFTGDMQVLSEEKLIVSIFGGFFIGLGIGLGMHGGCALDGIEILASYTWKRLGFSLSEIILGMNVIIFLISAIYFSWEQAFFSMLTYFVASKTIDYVVEGIEEYTGVTIVSAGKSDEIKEYLVEQLGRGITVFKGERGFMKGRISESQPCDIIYTVVTRLEVRRMKNNLHAIDHKAFIFTSSIKEASGGILKAKGARH
jgi:uncharacterized membrane-anchored protein YitT (DUF2179 family)/predicted metal-dependent HD superfamily phosphohydrolase